MNDVIKKHREGARGFRQLSKCWYGDACLQVTETKDEITMGFYYPHEGGGTSGEFTIKWIKLAGKWTPKLQCFDDAWSVLFLFSDVLRKLAELDGTNPTADDVAILLKSCGIQDMTESQSPY